MSMGAIGESKLEPLRGLELLRAQGRILVALMLRDIRTRFFGSAWGFLIVIAWPLAHILLLLGIYHVLGRKAPYGDSAALWFATGIIPYICFAYMTRMTTYGILVNRPLLAYPVVKITDIIFARAIVECLNAGLVVVITGLLFWSVGIDITPADPVEAGFALLGAMLLGFGLGAIGASIAGIFPMWGAVTSLVVMVSWAASGVIFVPEALPREIQVPLSYFPLLQCVEWMRSAYYEGYGLTLLDRGYVVSWGAGSLFASLALERLLRGRILQV